MSPMNGVPGESRGADLASAFAGRVSINTALTAIESDGHAISYAELLAKSLYLADKVRQMDPLASTPVGILIPRGINHILAQLAVVYAGKACVPLEMKMDDDGLIHILENLHSTLVLTDEANAHRLGGFRYILVEHRVIDTDDMNVPTPSSTSITGPRSCSHIFHTSGTSGKPKAVELFASGLLNLCLDPDANWIKQGQRVGHAASVVFDISLIEIWGSLLNGATIVVLPTEIVLDPLALSTFIKDQRLDVLQLTTSLLNVTAYACPGAFSTLDTLITGGEAINAQSIRAIFQAGPPRRIINGYGPTECCVYCLWHAVSRNEAQRGCIPVGKPFRDVEVYLVDETFRPVGVGEVGELLVAGPGVAGGYIGDERKTAERFISLPQAVKPCSQHPRIAYRTGDLMRRDERGVYYYIGRKDNQVKISGQRVELEAIESDLQETDLVHAATVVKITPEHLGSAPFLVAFCVATSADVTPAAIARDYIARFPRLLVPRFKLIEHFPLQASGKVDRGQLERQYMREIESTHPSVKAGACQCSNLKDDLRFLWLDVLGLPHHGIQPADDFIAMGGTSLMVATLIARIHHAFGVSLPASVLYGNMTLDRLAEFLTHMRPDGQASVSAHKTDEKLWLQDSELGREVHSLSDVPIVADWEAASEGRVFLTGATGFVGAFFLAQILQIPTVTHVCCLVRADDEAHGWSRLHQTLQKYQLHPPNLDKLTVLPGSFGKPDLGLSFEKYESYAEWASVVFHLGAQVNYLATYSAHRQDNVIGTLNMLKFAAHKRIKQTHYTSTIAAYGPTGFVLGTKFLPEDERPAPHMLALHYDTGYAQSQLVAESIVWNAIDNGLPIAIYRPGFVIGHSETGLCNPDDFISRLFASCMDMGTYPLLPRQRKEFVSVDFVAAALLHISRSPENIGHAFNLVHPDKDSAIDISTSFELLNRLASHRRMRPTTYTEWVQSLSLRPEDPLYPLVPMLREKVLGERTRWEVYEGMAEYGRSNLHRALRDAPEVLNCIPMVQLFERCLKSWLGQGAQEGNGK
ncbi:non-ribosomal peptide synthetase [Aspergillus mulundensis]|uniref:NRPS-like enzyme n=1 Tax=Aspergillus mulundensis TaxID=1810919 RepID=A0A3D8Q9N7_9EURO|nr:NRPS-like enzyme [Aspergillus mulundensis]RDW58553.1 NRPS-like enzyme [Aspergillus mulundensis]